MNEKFQWHSKVNTYHWVAQVGPMWDTHQQHGGGAGTLWCRQPGNWREDIGNATWQAIGVTAGISDLGYLAKCGGLDLLLSAILSIKHTYLQTSLSAFSFFQENIGNCITLPISIVHLCLFLYSLCTGNVFWLRFKSTSVPPKRSSLL